jgi:hypothetical protein
VATHAVDIAGSGGCHTLPVAVVADPMAAAAAAAVVSPAAPPVVIISDALTPPSHNVRLAVSRVVEGPWKKAVVAAAAAVVVVVVLDHSDARHEASKDDK